MKCSVFKAFSPQTDAGLFEGKSQKALAAPSPVRRFRVLPKDAQTYEIR